MLEAEAEDTFFKLKSPGAVLPKESILVLDVDAANEGTVSGVLKKIPAFGLFLLSALSGSDNFSTPSVAPPATANKLHVKQ